MLKTLLEKSRFIVIVAVICCFLATLALLGFGAFEMALIFKKAFSGEMELKVLTLKLIEVVDAFLLATVFFIIATGLYELFIDSNIEVPDWLEIKTLDDLKGKLVGVVIIVLGVIFLGNVAKWEGGHEIMGLGVGIGVVIAALTYFLSNKKEKNEKV